MISPTAAKRPDAGSRGPDPGSSGGRRFRAPTRRRARPGTARARGRRARGQASGTGPRAPPLPPRHGRPCPAGSVPAPRRLPVPDGVLLTPPNPLLGVRTHRCSSPPPPQTARALHTPGAGRRSPQRPQKVI